MENLKELISWNKLSGIIGIVGGLCSPLFGGFDILMEVLLFLMVADFFSGVLKSIITKRVSSKVGSKGIAKKVMILLLVAVANEVGKLTGYIVPVRSIVLFFYISNEGISILENAGEVLPIPEQLKNIFEQLKKK